MLRTTFSIAAAILLFGLSCTACSAAPPKKFREVTDPAAAAKEPAFNIQGEYQGEGDWAGAAGVKVGSQVIALGGNKFDVVVTKGGLPGDGWKRDDERFKLAGTLEGAETVLSGQGFSGKIAGEAMTITGGDGKTKLTLKRIVRHSPTEGAKPVEGAIVLFDGANADNFEHGILLKDGNLQAEAVSKQKFTDYTLHVEFRLSYMPEARGQRRSNSGVYLHDCYETQILDSFGLEGENNECGGFYKVRKPDVNVCYPPLTWQTYDFKFTSPKYQDGKKTANAKIEVRQNGVLIHPEFELPDATPGRQKEGPAPRSFYLQGHGNNVEFRNIWVKENK